LCVGLLNSAIFNSFHNRVEFGTILEGLQNFGGVLNTPNPPSVRHCSWGLKQQAFTSMLQRLKFMLK